MNAALETINHQTAVISSIFCPGLPEPVMLAISSACVALRDAVAALIGALGTSDSETDCKVMNCLQDILDHSRQGAHNPCLSQFIFLLVASV